MPIFVLIALIVGLSIAMYFVLRPLQVLNNREWLISHVFVIIGLLLILGWIWLNRTNFQEATMLMGGICTLAGGLCFITIYVSRRLKHK